MSNPIKCDVCCGSSACADFNDPYKDAVVALLCQVGSLLQGKDPTVESPDALVYTQPFVTEAGSTSTVLKVTSIQNAVSANQRVRFENCEESTITVVGTNQITISPALTLNIGKGYKFFLLKALGAPFLGIPVSISAPITVGAVDQGAPGSLPWPVSAVQSGPWVITSITNPVTITGTVVATVPNPLPVSQSGSWTVAATQSGTWNIGTLTSITNPVTVTGTVAATQSGTWNIGTVTSITNPVTVTGTVAVSGTVGVTQSTSPWVVSGTVAATQSGTWNIGTVTTVTTVTAVTSITNPVTVTGTVAATQSGTWNIGTVATITNPVTVTGTVAVSGTVAVTQSTSPWVVSGTVAATQSGTWNIGTLTSITNPVAVTQSGTWTISAVTTITNPVTVVGAAASGAAKSGNPVQTGAVFNTTQPTVTTGQVVESQATSRGALIVATGVDTFSVSAVQSGTWNIGTVTTVTAVTSITNPVAVTQSTSPWVVSGTVAATQSGTWNIATVTTVTTVSTVTAVTTITNPVTVVGAAASGASKSGNPVQTGAVFNTTQPTVTTGQMVENQATSRGALIVATGTDTFSVSAAQSGTWNIGTVATITNPVTVTGTVAVSGTVAVTQSTSPWVVSGTVAATQSGTWNIATVTTVTTVSTLTTITNPVTVVGAAASGASKSGNPVQTGAVFNTTQPTVTTGQMVENQATARGALIVATGTDTFSVSAAQSGTWNIGTVATITNPVAVTQSGTWNIATVTTLTTITNPVAVTQSGTWTISAVTSITNPVTVVGAAASGASKSGNPVQVGAVFNTTQPTVTTGQMVESQATARGALIVATGTDTFSVSAAQSGTWNIGTVTTVTTVSTLTTITNPVAVTQSGTWNIATVTAVTTITNPVTVVGAAASGAAKSGNPVQIGGVFNTTQPTVTNGQAVEAQMTARGAQIVATGTDTFSVSAAQSGTWNIGTVTTVTTVATLTTITNPVTVTGTVAATQSGTWNIGTVTTLTSITNPVTVVGAAASGAAKSGNPVQMGGVFNTTQPTVTNGQAVEAQMTARGAQIVATGTDTFSVSAAQSGTWNIGTVTTVTTVSTVTAVTSITNPVAVTQSGTWNIGTVTTLTSITNAVTVVGAAASGAAKSGNPVQCGAVFNTTQPTVTNGQAVENQATARGALIVATGTDTFAVSAAQSGTWNIATVTTVTTVSTVTAVTTITNPVTSVGAAASGAAKSGNPVQIGGVFNTTQPTVTNGQAVEAQMTARGAQIVATGTDTFSVSAAQSGTWNIGTVTTLTSITNAVTVVGAAASGAAKSGNPVQIGGVFNTTQPTVTNGQAVEVQATARGAQIVATGVDTFTVSAAQSGTWTVQPGNTANTTAWLTQNTPATSGGFTTYHLVSAASTNATNIKASAGQLYGWYIYNSNASMRKVAFHNTAGTPTAGASIFFTINLPGGSAANVFNDTGIPFGTGIAITTVTGLADSDATAVAANDLTINLFYK